MVVRFNPRQGGFQSTAPTNPIEKAIDKSQQGKDQPGVNRPTVYSGRGGGARGSNPIIEVTKAESVINIPQEEVKQVTTQQIVQKSSPTNFINDLLNKSKEVIQTGKSTRVGDFLIRQDKGEVVISDTSGVKYSINDLERARGNVVTTKKDFTPEEKKFIESQGKKIDFTSKTTPLTQAFTLAGKPTLEALDTLDKNLPTTENVFGIDLTKDIINEPKLFKDTADYTADIKETIGASTQVSPREKTFFEKIKVPINKNSISLKEDYDKISNDLNKGLIDQAQAQERLDGSIKSYVNKEAVRNIPKTVATGAAIGLLNVYFPVGGKIVNTALGTKLFLDRDKIKDQLKDFPVATAIDTASFLAGGIVGGASGNVLKGGKTKIEITPENFDRGINLVGNQRTQAVATAIQSVEPKYQVLVNQGKLTASDAFTAITKDGRSVTIVRLSKAKGSNLQELKGEDVLIGFEKLSKGVLGRRFIGKSTTSISPEGAETFTQGYVFKTNPKANKFFDRVNLKEAISVEVLERSKLVGTKATDYVRVNKIESQSKILRAESINKSLFNKIKEIQRKLDKGDKVGIYDIKSLINLEKRASGDKPFTEKEWNQSNIKQLTQTDVLTILDRAKGIAQRVEKGVVEAKTIRLDIRDRIIGRGTVKTIKEPVKRKVVTSKERGITTSEFKKNISKVNKQTGVEKQKPLSDIKVPKEKLTTVKQFSKQIDKVNKQTELSLARERMQRRTSGGALLAFGKVKKTTEFKTQIRPNLREVKTFVRGGAFTGQGTYERTESISAPITRESIISKVNDKVGTDFKDNTKIKLVDKLKVETNNLGRTRVSTNTFDRQIDQIKSEIKTDIQLKTKQNVLEKLKQPERIKTDLRNKITERTRLRSNPKTFPIIKPISNFNKKKEDKIKTVKKTSFVPFVKVKGKFQRASSKAFSTEQQALGIGFIKSKNVLGRSVIALKSSETPINSSLAQSQFTRLSKEFRPSKTLRNVAVQKNPLSTKRETDLIQRTRLNKQFKRVGAPSIRSIK